jgi:1-acyl-sn-glycerol-3-phosphate acyltransferase
MNKAAPRDFRWLASPEAPQRWQRHFWLTGLSLVERALLKSDVTGFEKLPARGPVIVYYNHIHYLDPFALSSRFWRQRYFVPVAKAELERTFFVGPALKANGTIFIKRRAPDIPALRGMLSVLQSGYVLLIAPEGTRSPTGALIEAEKGLGLLVYRTNPVLMPVGIWGTPDFPSAYKRLRRPVVHYRFGAPYRFNLPAKITRREAETLVTDYAMRRLAQCLPAEMRGMYAAPPSALPYVEEV